MIAELMVSVYSFLCIRGLPMTRLLTHNIATMTELREPQKVFDRAEGEPIAILKNSRCVGYFVPVEYVHGGPEQEKRTFTTMERVVAAIRDGNDRTDH